MWHRSADLRAPGLYASSLYEGKFLVNVKIFIHKCCQILFVTQFFYVFSAWSVKISVLFFYRSIFSTPKFKRASNIVLYVLIAWLIAFFVTLFQDNPISRNWGTVGTTINWRIFYIIEIATNVALDLFILCMPWPVIKQLHVTKKQKWLLVAIFGLGGLYDISQSVNPTVPWLIGIQAL